MREAAGIILAGGKATRMQHNKAFLRVREHPIIEEIVGSLRTLLSRIIIVTNTTAAYAHLGAQVVEDRFPGMGPLGGMQAGLSVSPCFYNFIVACDMPFVRPDLIGLLLDRVTDAAGRSYDVVVPRMADGRLQPLFAVYSRNCLEPITATLQQGVTKILSFYPQVRVRYIEETELGGDVVTAFFNVNTPEDLAVARSLAGLPGGAGMRSAGSGVKKMAMEVKNGKAMVPVVSVVGRSDTGKTTLMEKLVAELKRRGYRVGTIKHDAHQFEIDVPGKDSWRHRQAGADVVAISSQDKLAVIETLAGEKSLDEVVEQIAPGLDIVLTEGYKRADKPKIEVHRAERGGELLCNDGELLAVATDEPVETKAPLYDLNDAQGLVDLLVYRLDL